MLLTSEHYMYWYACTIPTPFCVTSSRFSINSTVKWTAAYILNIKECFGSYFGCGALTYKILKKKWQINV